MRQTLGLQETLGQIGFSRQKRGRRLTAKFAEIANEMGLIDIAAFESDLSPLRRGNAFGYAEDMLEPEDARQHFWRQANVIAEESLEFAGRYIAPVREQVHRDIPVSTAERCCCRRDFSGQRVMPGQVSQTG